MADGGLHTFIHLRAATMTKIIKEMLPPDVRVAKDAQDLLVECCVGKVSTCAICDLLVPHNLPRG